MIGPGSEVQNIGLACNHTMDKIAFCGQKCNLICFFEDICKGVAVSLT